MGTVLDSVDSLIAQAQSTGVMNRLLTSSVTASTTAATANSGLQSCQRYPINFTVPTLGSGVTSMLVTRLDMTAVANATQALVGGIEVEMGSLAVSSNTFTAGSAMPTKTIEGSSITTAAEWMFLVATVALTATTPVITITYVNQDGTGSRTATLTLPTSPAINTAFLVHPHLQSGDTGIRSVTNMSKSAGTAGTLKLYGLLPLGTSVGGGNKAAKTFQQEFSKPTVNYPVAAAEKIGFYRIGQTAANDMYAVLCAIGDN